MDNQPGVITPAPQPPEPVPVSMATPPSGSAPSQPTPSKIKHAHKFILGYIALIILVAAVAGVYTWQHKKVNSLNAQVNSLQEQVAGLQKTKTSNTTTAQPANPYAGWQTYSNSQVSFKYPSNWTASKGPASSQSTVADATSPAFTSSAMTTADNPGAQVTFYLQLSTDSSTIDCAGAPCQVTAVTPLSNSQLPDDVLAVVNQTSGNGTNFTEYVVASSNTVAIQR